MRERGSQAHRLTPELRSAFTRAAKRVNHVNGRLWTGRFLSKRTLRLVGGGSTLDGGCPSAWRKYLCGM